MLSIDYDLSVPGFPTDEIGFATLVRVHHGNLQLKIVNDGETSFYKLNVRTVLELYVGQEKPQLFVQSDTNVIETIPPKGMVASAFTLYPNFPGLVSVAVYITDINGKAVMSKRKTEKTYQELPVRYWFHVLDDIPVKTLMTIRDLVARLPKEEQK